MRRCRVRGFQSRRRTHTSLRRARKRPKGVRARNKPLAGVSARVSGFFMARIAQMMPDDVQSSCGGADWVDWVDWVDLWGPLDLVI